MIKVNGLPNSVRESLLQRGHGRAAMVLDLLYTLGVSQAYVSIREIEELFEREGLSVPTRLVRAAFNSGLFDWKYAEPEGKGRPAALYYVPSVNYFVRNFAEGKVGETDGLLPDDFVSLTAYRAGLHREFIRRAPGQYSRTFLSRRLGLTKNASRAYETDEAWEVSSRFSFSSVPDLLAIPERAVRGASWLLAVAWEDVQDIYLNIRLHSKADLPGQHLPFCRFLAGKFQRAGFAVYKVTQQCNVYRFNEASWSSRKGQYAWAYG